MQYPVKWLELIKLFRQKRDVRKAGVDGFTTPFEVNLEEIESIHIDGMDELTNMLDTVLTKETVVTEDGITEPVVKNYERTVGHNRSFIRIYGCSTDKLNRYETKIRKSIKDSAIIQGIDDGYRIVRYLNRGPIKMKKNRWGILSCLRMHFPEKVSYKLLYKAIHGTRQPVPVVLTTIQISQIGTSVNDLKKHLIVKLQAPEDCITNEKRYGYRLNI